MPALDTRTPTSDFLPKICLILLFLLTSSSTISMAQEGGSWTSGAALNISRQESPLIYLDGKIYQTGGIGTSRNAIKSVEVYDVVTDSWSNAAELPVTLHHHSGAAIGTKLYTIGGYSATQFIESTLLYEYSPANNTWTQLSAVPRQIGAQASVVLNGEIYVFGGTYFNAAFTHSYKYNPTTDTWTELQPLPLPSEHLAAAVVDGKIYVSGGRRIVNFRLTNRADLQVYSPDTDSWELKSPMGAARAGHASASVNSRLYVFGGESFEEGPEVIESVEEYDPVTDSWRYLDEMPQPRHGIGAVVVNSQVFISAGGDVAGFSTSGNTAIFSPPALSTFSEFETEFPTEVDLISVYPNPTSRISNVRIELNQSSRISMQIVDVLGRKVSSGPDRIYRAGVHEIKLDLGSLNNGVFFVALRINDSNLIREIQVLR